MTESRISGIFILFFYLVYRIQKFNEKYFADQVFIDIFFKSYPLNPFPATLPPISSSHVLPADLSCPNAF